MARRGRLTSDVFAASLGRTRGFLIEGPLLIGRFVRNPYANAQYDCGCPVIAKQEAKIRAAVPAGGVMQHRVMSLSGRAGQNLSRAKCKTSSYATKEV